MRWSTVLLLGLGLVSALLAALLVSSIRGGGSQPIAAEIPQEPAASPPQAKPTPEPTEPAEAPEPAEPVVETVRILVAARDLEPFQVVDTTDLGSLEVPRDELPEGAVTSPSDTIGRVLLEPLAARQPFRLEMLAEGPEVDLATIIVPGKRAVTLTLDSGTGDLIRPGSVVDVIASVDVGGQPVSMTLLQSVLVLAVGDRSLVSPAGRGAPRGASTSVSLLVDVRGAESLLLVQGQGRLSLALRNPDDADVVDMEPTRLREIAPRTPARVATPPPPSNRRDVVVMKGGTTEVRSVRTGEEDE